MAKGRGPSAEGRGVEPDDAGPGAIRSHRDLIAWQKAYALAVKAMKSTAKFPADERFGLALQIRRSAVSVPSNIAEGFGRGSREDYTRFLYIARGSLYELSTQISIAAEMGYLSPESSDEVSGACDECERILWGLIRALERNTTG